MLRRLADDVSERACDRQVTGHLSEVEGDAGAGEPIQVLVF
jgi:hypothetical protein